MTVPLKEESLNEMWREIVHLLNSEVKENEKKSICEFIGRAINGANSSSPFIAIPYVIIDISPTATPIICIYILMNLRFIQIKIENIIEISSVTYLLNDIVNIKRNLLAEGSAKIEILFKSGIVGLKYPQNHDKTIEFFQKVETCWAYKDLRRLE